MFSRYRAVFRTPGSAAFSAASFVMRMPIAIYPIGIVLIISARDGRYGFAGVLSACYVFGTAVGNPVLSRLVDRFGQTRMILPSSAVHAVAVVLLAVLVRTSAPNGWLVAPAVVLGFSYLSVGSMVRTRWSHALADGSELATALSLESVLDEVIFVFGPLLATVLATQATPVLVLYLGLGLVAVGSLWLAMQRATDPPAQDPGSRRERSALRVRGMLLLTLAMTSMGAVFASIEVSAVAYCGQHGARGLSGVALAAIAAGSAVSGLVYGSRDRPGALHTRLRTQALVFGVLPLVLLAVVDVPVLVVACFAVGLGIAPCLITAFGLVQQLVPARSLTEGLAWATTGLSIGYGAGASTVGGIADQHGARTAFLVVVGAGVLVAAFGWALHARLTGDAGRVPDPVVVGGRCED